MAFTVCPTLLSAEEPVVMDWRAGGHDDPCRGAFTFYLSADAAETLAEDLRKAATRAREKLVAAQALVKQRKAGG